MKKTGLLFFVLVFSFVFSYSQNPGEWTWMNGDSAQLPVAHYGTQGVFDSLNTPPDLYEACEWTDKQGYFWLFGGANNYSDLWKFDPSINQWAWIKGPGTMNQSGIYGTRGIPSSSNNPGARSWGCATWVDADGNLWLFGGVGYDVNGWENMLNDLWKYDISSNEWTWMQGSDTAESMGHYGVLGISDPSNTPPCIWENNGSWTDGNNNLWLFGGDGWFGSFDDLWKYNISTNEWTWIKGSGAPSPPAVYGIKGIPNVNNSPGGRAVYSKWKDSEGNFWFFGGGYPGYSVPNNDLWKYNIFTNEWTWISGDSVPYKNTVLNTSDCIPSANNIPSARYENRACWTIQGECDNFQFFGGYGTVNYHADLWNYNVFNNAWTLMKGDTSKNYKAVFGTKTVSNPNNTPSGSCGGSIGWKDSNGNLWLFGGNGGGNSMWRYVPDLSCPFLCITDVGVVENSSSKANVQIYPNPLTYSSTLQFTSQLKDAEVIIYDMLGHEMMRKKMNGDRMEIERGNLVSGVYFVKVVGEERQWVEKIVVE